MIATTLLGERNRVVWIELLTCKGLLNILFMFLVVDIVAFGAREKRSWSSAIGEHLLVVWRMQ